MTLSTGGTIMSSGAQLMDVRFSSRLQTRMVMTSTSRAGGRARRPYSGTYVTAWQLTCSAEVPLGITSTPSRLSRGDASESLLSVDGRTTSPAAGAGQRAAR